MQRLARYWRDLGEPVDEPAFELSELFVSIVCGELTGWEGFLLAGMFELLVVGVDAVLVWFTDDLRLFDVVAVFVEEVPVEEVFLTADVWEFLEVEDDEEEGAVNDSVPLDIDEVVVVADL